MNLRSRVVLAVAAVFAGVSLLAGWLMLTRTETSLQTAFDRSARTRADWLLSLVSLDPVVIPLPAEAERMRLVYENYGRSRELFRSPGWPDASGRVRTNQRHAKDQPHSYRTVTVLSSPDLSSEGRIRLSLAMPDASLRQDLSRLRWLFVLGWLSSLLLAFGAGYVVAGWLLKPIQTIVGQADSISNAITIDPIPLPTTHDELYQLADSLNRMLVRIRESAELQRNFFGAAAHELRTPLTVMKTGLEVTLNSGRADAPMGSFLAGQLEEVSRLTRLLDEFLTLSRPEESPSPLRLEEIKGNELIGRCVAKLTPLATDYGVGIRVVPVSELTQPLLTDAVKLEHILMNLLENAVKYAIPGSVIQVQFRESPDWGVRIENRTNREKGPTFDLMQPYFRADPLKEGYGLGLWISHRLTTLLGGRLHLEWQSFTFVSELTLPSQPIR